MDPGLKNTRRAAEKNPAAAKAEPGCFLPQGTYSEACWSALVAASLVIC